MLDGGISTVIVAGLAALALSGAVFALLYPYISGERAKDKRIQGISEARKHGCEARRKVGGTRRVPGHQGLADRAVLGA